MSYNSNCYSQNCIWGCCNYAGSCPEKYYSGAMSYCYYYYSKSTGTPSKHHCRSSCRKYLGNLCHYCHRMLLLQKEPESEDAWATNGCQCQQSWTGSNDYYHQSDSRPACLRAALIWPTSIRTASIRPTALRSASLRSTCLSTCLWSTEPTESAYNNSDLTLIEQRNINLILIIDELQA